ncbi:hypothetical protein P9727_20145, partial [Parageobacillus thermoglucosidasius]|nr:hypothetical protein [Parageobacillus thermoglucosidasius]
SSFTVIYIEPWLHSSLCLMFLVHYLFYQRGSNMALFLFPFLHNYMDLTLEKARERYWGIQNVVAKEIPLLSIPSPEDIRTKIFRN